MKWWCILLFLLLGACSRSQEEVLVIPDDVPNGVAGKLLLSDKSEAEGASVYLLNEYGVITDSVLTSLSGEFFFETIPDGAYEVFARATNGESGWIYSESRVDSEHGENFILGASSVITVSIEPLPDSASVFVQVAGLPYYDVLQEGKGVLGNLPQGRYEVEVFSNTSGEGTGRVFYMKDTIVLELDTVRLEYNDRYSLFNEGLHSIDDFEHELGSMENEWGSQWWPYTDGIQGGGTAITFIGTDGGHLFTEPQSGNKVAAYHLELGAPGSYAGLGFFLTTDQFVAPFDVREIKNMHYLVKGSGSYTHQICFESDILQTLACSKPSYPDSEWQLYQTGPTGQWADGLPQGADLEESLQWANKFLILLEQQGDESSGDFYIDGLYVEW
ncbi:MAG: carboxypeptidase-like regulatory domain-containing protein [Fibrobacterales bacterium]